MLSASGEPVSGPCTCSWHDPVHLVHCHQPAIYEDSAHAGQARTVRGAAISERGRQRGQGAPALRHHVIHRAALLRRRRLHGYSFHVSGPDLSCSRPLRQSTSMVVSAGSELACKMESLAEAGPQFAALPLRQSPACGTLQSCICIPSVQSCPQLADSASLVMTQQ